MASMEAKMEATMEQLRALDGGPVLGASSTAYSQLEWHTV